MGNLSRSAMLIIALLGSAAISANALVAPNYATSWSPVKHAQSRTCTPVAEEVAFFSISPKAPAKKAAAKKALAKNAKPAPKKLVAKKPVAIKKPVAKKPVAKKPVAKKTVVKKAVNTQAIVERQRQQAYKIRQARLADKYKDSVKRKAAEERRLGYERDQRKALLAKAKMDARKLKQAKIDAEKKREAARKAGKTIRI